ncbi:hypothetical protein CH267_06835 [Rhodococcus sp. 06-621-2]|nr:hypothetical protein CH267_06835 [Rhodococcus sp. 06-621-2]
MLIARLRGGSNGDYGPALLAELASVVARAETDDGVGAVVITGAHPTRFGHADIRWLEQAGTQIPDVGPRLLSMVLRVARAVRSVKGGRRLVGRTPLAGAIDLIDFHDTLLRINRCGAVFIAAINGTAVGLGSELALACDYRLMAEGGHVIGQPEVLLGLSPGGGGSQRLSRLIGSRHGLRLMLDGGGLDPASAMEIGYVDDVVPADELISRAVALGDRFARRSKPTVAAIKRDVHIGASRSIHAGLHLESAEFLSSLSSPRAQRVMRAYIESTAERGDLPLYNLAMHYTIADRGTFGDGRGSSGVCN